MTIPDLTSGDRRKPMFREKKRSLWKWPLRIILFVLVLLLLFIGALSVIGGSTPGLEKSFESFLSELTGKKVVLDRISHVDVFPDVTVAFDGLVMRPYTFEELQDRLGAPRRDKSSSDEPDKGDINNRSTGEEAPQSSKSSREDDVVQEGDLLEKRSLTQEEIKNLYDNQDKTVLTIEKGMLKASFFDVVFKNQKLKDLLVEGLRVIPESGEPFYLNSLRMDPGVFMTPGGSSPQPGLAFEGQLAGKTFSGQAALEVELNKNKNIVKYRLDRPAPFTVKYGDYASAGVLQVKSADTIVLKDIALIYGEDQLATGDLTHIAAANDRPRTIKGRLAAGETVLKFDLGYMVKEDDAALWKGEIAAEPLQINDLSGEGAALVRLKESLSALAGKEDQAGEGGNEQDSPSSPASKIGASALFGDPHLELDIRIDALKNGDSNIGRVKFHLARDDEKLAIEQLDGKLSDGEIKGRVMLERKEGDLVLSSRASIFDLAYGDLQESMTEKKAFISGGDADLELQLKGRGDTLEELKGSLSGSVRLVAGEGEMVSDIVNKWGGGLINALLPRRSNPDELKLNCAVIDLEFEAGTGEARTLFLDTRRVTVNGEGHIRLADNKVNLLLRPTPKKTTLVDIAPAVLIRGDLDSPKITPSKLSVLNKLGRVVVGTVNPALLALTLSNLGVGDQHPCRPVIENMGSGNMNGAPPEDLE